MVTSQFDLAYHFQGPQAPFGWTTGRIATTSRRPGDVKVVSWIMKLIHEWGAPKSMGSIWEIEAWNENIIILDLTWFNLSICNFMGVFLNTTRGTVDACTDRCISFPIGVSILTDCIRWWKTMTSIWNHGHIPQVLDIPSDCIGYVTGSRRAALGGMEELKHLKVTLFEWITIQVGSSRSQLLLRWLVLQIMCTAQEEWGTLMFFMTKPGTGAGRPGGGWDGRVVAGIGIADVAWYCTNFSHLGRSNKHYFNNRPTFIWTTSICSTFVEKDQEIGKAG